MFWGLLVTLVVLGLTLSAFQVWQGFQTLNGKVKE